MSAAMVHAAWRTPLGADVDEVFGRLCSGDRAFAPHPDVPPEGYRCSLGARIPGLPEPSRHRRFLDRVGLFALDVATQAAQEADVQGSDRVGLFCAVGGLRANWGDMLRAYADQRLDGADSWRRGLGKLHPFFMLRHLSNNAHALISADLGIRGEGATFGGATAGAQAIAAADRALTAGAVDVAMVVAYDSLLDPQTLVTLGEIGSLTAASLATLSAPYDSHGDGGVPGEAAVALVLRRTADSPRDSARISARAFADGSPGEPGPPCLLRAVRLASRAGLVDGAARGVATLDRAELDVLPPDALVTATVASLGRIGAATGPVQAVVLATALARGIAPPVPLSRSIDDRVVKHPTPINCGIALAMSTGHPGLVGAIRVERS